tara:strand:- start:2190 stop:3401 length:1212 start_codon:yes stop_codon:yes gene_type:complete
MMGTMENLPSYSDVPASPERSYQTTVTTSKELPEVTSCAQALNTAIYLREGFIDSEQLDADGIYRDQYVDRSVYLYASNERRETACRYIKADRKAGGVLSLPTLQHFSVDPEIIREVAGVERLSAISPSQVIEVSALASLPREGDSGKPVTDLDATRLIYSQILRHSLDAGHRLWVMNTHPRLVRHLRILLGDEQVRQIGDERDYMGSVTMPVALNPQEVVRSALDDDGPLGAMKREYLQRVLPGVKGGALTPALRETLDEHEIPYGSPNVMQRLKKHHKALAYTGITAYAAARAVPLASIEEFQGNPWVFWGIDVGTAFPYTWGLIEVATAKKPARKVLGGAVAAGSFAAPYVYFWAEGEQYPVWVNGIVAGIIGVAGLAAVRGVKKDLALDQGLRRSTLEV